MANSNNIFKTTDIFDREVVLEKSTWDNHVVDGHPEMCGNENAVKCTVEGPEFVYESDSHTNRDVFFARQENSTHPKLYTKVIVEYNGNTGEVVTSWFCKEVKGVNERGLKYVKPKI